MKIDNLCWRRRGSYWVLTKKTGLVPTAQATIELAIEGVYRGVVPPRTAFHIGPYASLCKTMRACERCLESIPETVQEALKV